jgi:spore maturation protein CgeB
MPKVLIIGPDFYNFNISIADAFVALGWETTIESYDLPVHPFKGWLKWRHKFALNKKEIQKSQKAKYQFYIQERFAKEKPDFVFILNGDMLSTTTLDLFRKDSKTVLWLFDSISNITTVTNHIDHVDYCFCYEQEDVDFYTRSGKKAYFLPQAYDPQFYYPEENQIKDIDILFVGNLYISKRRQQHIKQVIKSFPDKKIVIFGEYKPWYKNPVKWLLREQRNIYMNRNIPYCAVNSYYNRAYVVLNIHHEQQKNGANPKVFEISGSGAYQVCDSNRYLEILFPNNEIGLFQNEEDLINKIEYALTHNMEENAMRAQQIVSSQHTFKHRIKEVIELCYS